MDSVDSTHPDSDEGYTGAGVLPFALCGNEIFVLLGQERFLSHTGKVTYVWSDFGGRRDDADGGDMLVTAAREFEEETLGLFPPIEEVLRSGVVEMPANAATAGAAVSAIGTARSATRSSTMACVNGKYRMFVAPVVFIDAFMFNLATQALEQEQEQEPAQCGVSGGSSGEGKIISGSVGSNGGVKSRAMAREKSEKLDFCWVPAASLAAVVGCEGSSPNVYVRVGARRLQLFHKFVISLRRGPMTDVLSHMMAERRESSLSSSSSSSSYVEGGDGKSGRARCGGAGTMADSTCFAGQRRRRLGIIVPETKRRCNGKQRRRQRQTREYFENSLGSKNAHAGTSDAGGGGGVGSMCSSTSKVDDADGAVIGAGGVGGASGEGGAGGASGAAVRVMWAVWVVWAVWVAYRR